MPKYKELSKSIDEFIAKQMSTGGLNPPGPGLVFDRNRHRWVKPDTELGMGFKPAVVPFGSKWKAIINDNRDHIFDRKSDAKNFINEWASNRKLGKIAEEKKTPEQIELEEYNAKIHNISKALRFKNREEAEAYGIKLPADFDKPKPESKPKLPKIKPVDTSSSPQKKTSSISNKTDGGLEAKDVARVISPKGSYRDPMQIVEDVQESQKLGNKIAGAFKKGDALGELSSRIEEFVAK